MQNVLFCMIRWGLTLLSSYHVKPNSDEQFGEKRDSIMYSSPTTKVAPSYITAQISMSVVNYSGCQWW